YSAPQAFFVNQGVKELSRLDERMSVGNTDLFLAQRIQQKILSDEELRSIGILHTRPIRGNLTFGYTILSDYNLRHPNDLAVLQHLADASDLLRRPEDGLAFRKQIAGMLPNDANALESYGWQKYIYERTRGTVIGGFETQEFEKLFRRSIELTRDTVDRFRVRLADMFFGTQQYQKAVDNYRRALQIRETYTADTHIRQDVLLLQLARGLHELGHTDRALGFALQATAYNPKNEAAKDFIYTIWMNGSSRGDSLKKKL
ncbi:MAG: tetratricopeptide repeat protein, partial [Bacteroidota bacterium]